MGVVGRRGMRWGGLAGVAVFVAMAAAGCGGSSATPLTVYITRADLKPAIKGTGPAGEFIR